MRPTQGLLYMRGTGAICLYRANGPGGFGSQTAADPCGDPRRTPEKQTVGTVTASHKMLTLQALSSSLIGMWEVSTAPAEMIT